jgi:hypothetical protein
LGVDVIDNVLSTRQNDYLTSKYLSILLQAGTDEKEAQTKSQQLSMLYDQTLDESKDNL